VTKTPPRVIARPSRGTPARDNGRAVAYQDVLTVPPETNKDNHEVVALRPSSPSTPPRYPLMLILSAAEQGCGGGVDGVLSGLAGEVAVDVDSGR
jgi:hypothetical protein